MEVGSFLLRLTGHMVGIKERNANVSGTKLLVREMIIIAYSIRESA